MSQNASLAHLRSRDPKGQALSQMVATLDLKPLFEVGFHDVIDPKTEPILLEVKNIAEYLCEYSINPFSTNVIFPYSKVRMAHYIY